MSVARASDMVHHISNVTRTRWGFKGWCPMPDCEGTCYVFDTSPPAARCSEGCSPVSLALAMRVDFWDMVL